MNEHCLVRGSNTQPWKTSITLPAIVAADNSLSKTETPFKINFSPLFESHHGLLIHSGYVIEESASQENSSGLLTPYCLALQWHDYTSLPQDVFFFFLFFFITIICPPWGAHLSVAIYQNNDEPRINYSGVWDDEDGTSAQDPCLGI